MDSQRELSSDRVYFLDNIRYLMVLLVVVLHSGGYINPMWPVYKPMYNQSSWFLRDLLLLLDVFLMPVLFFIAGFFALPSFEGKSPLQFVKHKFKRLGIPWILGILLYGPMHVYIWRYSRGVWPTTYRDCFLKIIEDVRSWQLPQYYFWFISLLLLFFIIFALTYKAKQMLFGNSGGNQKRYSDSNRRILAVIFISSIIIAIFSILTHTFYDGPEWARVANIIQFQVDRIALYVICFGLGIYAFRNDWFKNNKSPGNAAVWGLISVALWLLLMKYPILFTMNSFYQDVFYTLTRTFFVFSVLLALISFGVKYWDSGSPINRLFAKNSYNIYLVHMIFVVLSQLFLFQMIEGYFYFKFLFVSIFSIGISLLISKYVIHAIPKTFLATMTGCFAILLVFA